MSGQRKYIIFVAKVFALILIFSLFWPFVAPGYASLLAAASNGISASNVSISAIDSSIIIRFGAQLEPFSLHSLTFQAGLLLLLALIIVTPGLKLRQRLPFIAIATVLTFALHIASVLIMSSNARALRPMIVLFASVGVDLFPILIWIILSARYWWPGRKALSPGYAQD